VVRSHVLHLLQVVPCADNTSSTNSIRAQKVAPANITILPLSHTQRNEIVHHAPAEDPIARSAQTSESKTRSNLHPHGRLSANEVRNARVVQEVQDANAREGLRNDVRQDAAPALGVHRLELCGDVPNLHDAVDPDEDVGGLKGLAVPEEHPGADADVADGVVRNELHDLVEFFLLRWVVGGVFPELVEPGELETFRVLIGVVYMNKWRLRTYSCCGKKKAPMKYGLGDQNEMLRSWISSMLGLELRPYCWRAKSYANDNGAR
jgi:hypothetical protein